MISSERHLYKCNRHGSGYKIQGRVVTTFEKRVLFLSSCINHEAEPKSSVQKGETSRSAEIERSSSAASGIKRKVESKEEDDQSSNNENDGVKRIRTKSTSSDFAEEEEETSLEEAIFSNDLLLRNLFAYLNVKDLKSCRQVNTLWYLEATNILHKRNSMTPIQISDSTVFFQDDINVYKDKRRTTILPDFHNILTNSKLFPSPNFALNDNALSDNVKDFFRDNGHLVKSLCFKSEDIPAFKKARATVEDILLLSASNFPNLRVLKLVDVEDDQDEDEEEMLEFIENAPDMEKLQTLELNYDFSEQVLSTILNKARNLKNIYLNTDTIDDNNLWEILLELENVIPRLKNINLSFLPYSLNILEQLIKQKPRFSTIEEIRADFDGFTTYNLDAIKIGEFLTDLFYQCSESLTEILGVHCLGHIPHVSIPVFPNVKLLGIEYSKMVVSPLDFESRAALLPEGVDLAHVFPNLRIIKWKFSNEVLANPERTLSESLSPLLSVRELEVKWGERYIPEGWVKKFCYLFPNVTSAKFCELIPDAGYKFIWKLSKLQELHLAIGTKPRVNLRPSLDAGFTGFSFETVQELGKKDVGDLNLSTEEVSALRINPCISDLQELRKLSLCLFDWITNEETRDSFAGEKNADVTFDPGSGKSLLQVESRTILSYVSKRYGFDLCSQLKSNVSVEFTHYTKLEGELTDSDDDDDDE